MNKQYISPHKLKLNPDNPRTIKDTNFNKLVNSIKEFPEMLEIRPIVVNKDLIVLGGNMRLRACKEAGLKEVPYIIADELTEEKQREFVIKDNISGGEWDWEILANEWDSGELNDWGLDVPEFKDLDYGDKNEEIDIDSLDGNMKIVLEYTFEDYTKVKDGLTKIAQTPEQAVYKLLGYE